MPLAVGAQIAGRFTVVGPRDERSHWARDGDERVVLEILKGSVRWQRALDQCLGTLRSRRLVGVVPIQAFGRHRKSVYLVTKPVTGTTLEAVPFGELLERLGEALQILGTMHALGIRHGAFEPDAILVTAEGVMLAEVGRCQPFGSAADAIGTPAYLAPELVTGRHADGRADLFSCGVLLRRLMEGRGDTPERLPGLVASLLQADPDARPASAFAVAEALAHPKTKAPERAATRALAGLARALADAPEAVATAERAAELVEDLLAAGDAVGVETVVEATRAARRAHPTAWLSAARAVVAAFVSVPTMLAAIDVLAASHPGEAISAIALLRRGRRAEPIALYKRAGLAYLAAGREDRAAHYLSRIFPPGRVLRREVERLRDEVARLRARCGELQHALDDARKKVAAPKVVDTRVDRERSQDERLRRALRDTDFNVSETARRLGISRPTVYRRMRRLGLTE